MMKGDGTEWNIEMEVMMMPLHLELALAICCFKAMASNTAFRFVVSPHA
jgi:hypothetical protein